MIHPDIYTTTPYRSYPGARKTSSLPGVLPISPGFFLPARETVRALDIPAGRPGNACQHIKAEGVVTGRLTVNVLPPGDNSPHSVPTMWGGVPHALRRMQTIPLADRGKSAKTHPQPLTGWGLGLFRWSQIVTSGGVGMTGIFPDSFFEIFGMRRKGDEMKDFVELGYDLGKLVQDKDEAYGDSCGRVAEIMKVLYPHGVPVMAYPHMLIMIRVLDKLCRLSTNPKALGENPWMDIAGYGLKGMQVMGK